MPQSNQSTDDNFITLVSQYEKLIFSICYRMTGNYFDAEDLTQETYIAAYKALDHFDGDNPKAWLTKIATNKCLDFVKQAERRTSPMEDSEMELVASTVDPPENQVMEDMVRKRLRQTCQSLKPPYDQVALSYYYDQKTATQIASETGKNKKTVQTQIARAKGMLQKLWKKEELL